MWYRLSSLVRGKRNSRTHRDTRSNRLANFESLERREMLTIAPTGVEFLVGEGGTTHRGMPTQASVAIVDSGTTIAAWEDQVTARARLGGNDSDILVQRAEVDDEASADGVIVNSVTQGEQIYPTIDAAEDGTYWVAWSGRGQGDRSGVFAQRFAADGTAMGDAIRVNETVGGTQTRPDIVAGDDGSAVVAWSGVGVQTDNEDFDGVFMRRVGADGDFSSDETRVNTTVDGQQNQVAVGMNSSGQSVITWSSRNNTENDWDLFAQRYSADGSADGTEFMINGTTEGSQIGADVGMADDGTMVVAWNSYDQQTGSWDVYARQFAADGSPAGDEIQVSESTDGHQQDAAISVAPAGEFIVAWSNGVEGGNGWETMVRAFTLEGVADGDALTVNSSAGANSGHQRNRAVDLNEEGQAVVLFHGASSLSNRALVGQRFDVDVEPPANVAPVIVSIDGENVLANLRFEGQVGELLSIPIVASDNNSGDTLTYTLDESQSPDDAVIRKIDNNNAVVEWTPSIEDLGSGGVEFRVLVTDDGDGMLGTAQGFIVDVDNTAPVIDLNGSAGGTGFVAELPMEDTVVDVVDRSELTIVESEQTTLVSATATLTGILNSSLEQLLVDTTGTDISSTYEPAAGTLQLTGEDTIDNYITVLRTLQYQNLETDRTEGGRRQINITVNDGSTDGSGVSNEATADVIVLGVNATPALVALPDVTLLSGSPLNIPLVASDDDGDELTFTITSSNEDVVGFVPQGNRSARISVASPSDSDFVGGDMVFELFEQRAPRATSRIIELANDSFYDGIIFHRVPPNFVIQTGDPTGTGTGGSDLGDFDDQFHAQLQHNQSGVLSMAKSLDDTNDSQFFVTNGAFRNLDSQHTVFGQLVTGDDVRAEIQSVDTVADRPVNDVVIEDFEIFVDNQNGILVLSAAEGTTGSATITVVASDGRGGTSTQSFDVTVTPDTHDNQPWLLDVDDPVVVSADDTTTFTIEGIDLEGDEFAFIDQDEMTEAGELLPLDVETSDDLIYFVDPNTGVVTVVASNGLTGRQQIRVGVVDTDFLNGVANRPIDLQVIDLDIVAN